MKPQCVSALLAVMAPGATPPRATEPGVPSGVVAELHSRGCKIPPGNSRAVTQGEFFKPGQLDWAALCITKKSGTLLVFQNGSREHVEALETQLRTFSTWSIHTFARERLTDIQSALPRATIGTLPVDHDAIASFLEYGDKHGGCLYCYSAFNKTYYRLEGNWMVVQTIDVN